MKFETLPIAGAMKVSIERHADHRGFFARTFCIDEFSAHGLPTAVIQSSMSYNAKAGTVRGMHFQWPPSREDKLVRCVRGAIYDVLIDLRPNSPSYLQHVGVRLDDRNRDAVMIPHGVAHGFQTLVDDTEVFYQMTDRFAPDLANGFRWNDRAFGIEWPLAEITIAPRDADYPDFDRAAFERELARHDDGAPRKS
ncbi:MAG TPA: dTDP-4-dehydrorhamnose 3,5-epimerase [Steroidobacteraceae bacterium]|nr:dTDP-4-dehydrorhamnose 3,5-epimerase [Steroidobacteraceae bacterium]